MQLLGCFFLISCFSLLSIMLHLKLLKSSRVWHTHNPALTELPSSGARRRDHNHAAKIGNSNETTKLFDDFLHFTTRKYLVTVLCRKFPTPSQQVDEECAIFLGVKQKSPYLCIVIKIHTLVS